MTLLYSTARTEQPIGPAKTVAGGAPSFRPDIEGLRAVAVIVVVLFHAGVTAISGGYVGVDVFFVISGFLITSQLLRELTRTGRISIARFYARRVLRLLPASIFVVTATLAASWLWLPPLRVRGVAYDALTTTVYGLNYRLASQGTDYLAATQSPSPLQHFWSLAVEEQFYLLWPPLLLVASLCWRYGRPRPPSRAGLVSVFGVVIVVSFALSVWQTARSAPWAYFGAQTRAWELAVGGIISVTAPVFARLPRGLATTARYAGLAGILLAAVMFDEKTAFPGSAALLPVGATALVVIGGCRRPSSALLGIPPLQSIGRLSYGWYLWHWPVLTIAPFVFGSISAVKGLGLAALSLFLAVVTSRKVEQPMRTMAWLRARTHRGLVLGVAMSSTLAGIAILVPARLLPSTAGVGDATDAAAAISGASGLSRKMADLVATSVKTRAVPANLKPRIEDASADVARFYREGCSPATTDAEVKKPCVYGDRSSSTVVVLFGDSHAGHWFPALDMIATQRHWKLVVVSKNACSAATSLIYLPTLKRPFTECARWRDSAIDYITALQPAMVVMSSNGHGPLLNPNGNQDQAWAAAWDNTFQRLPSKSRLVLINDTAWPAGNIPECVSNHMTKVDACNRARGAALSDGTRRQLVDDAAVRHHAVVVDPALWMCTNKVCPAIIGNVLVYKDESHLSATFSTLVAPALAETLPPLS